MYHQSSKASQPSLFLLTALISLLLFAAPADAKSGSTLSPQRQSQYQQEQQQQQRISAKRTGVEDETEEVGIAPTAQAVAHVTNRTISESLFFELEELSRLVGISYCVGYSGIHKPFACLSHCAEFEGFELVETWDSGLLDSSSCGYLALSHAPNPPRIVLAFRGSNSLSDALSDLMTLPAEYTPWQPPTANDTSKTASSSPSASQQPQPQPSNCDNCKVHSGFLSAWHTTRDSILPTLRDTVWKYPGYKLVLAGHSLGGAIAGLAALDFEAMGWAPTVTTFGEPRWGNAEMAAFVDDTFPTAPTAPSRSNREEGSADVAGDGKPKDRIGRYRRVTHVGDPIPHYPPHAWGWRPHSGEVYIAKAALPPSREDVVLCDGPQDPKCIDGGDAVVDAPGDDAEGGVGQTPVLQARGLTDYLPSVPSQWRLWEILFAHREYFWRLGLCWDPQSGGYPKVPVPEPGLVLDADEL